MAQTDVSSIRQALTVWHEKLISLPATKGALFHEPELTKPEARCKAVAIASEQLAACLEDADLPDGLIDDLLNVCDTFTALCGVDVPMYSPASNGLQSNGMPLNPAKLKLLKAATGLPVHTTSIGRRASASYCVYDSIGGWETLSAAVESVYNRMRNDPRCASMFSETNEQSFKTHTLEFLTCALGGKARFASSTLLTSQRDQLRSHGFGVGQFDVMLQHMKAALDELGVQSETAASAVALLRCHKYLFEKRVSESAEEEPAPAVF